MLQRSFGLPSEQIFHISQTKYCKDLNKWVMAETGLARPQACTKPLHWFKYLVVSRSVVMMKYFLVQKSGPTRGFGELVRRAIYFQDMGRGTQIFRDLGSKQKPFGF